MADHPLRPATRRRLGAPLPHQLTDRTRVPHAAHKAFPQLPGRSCALCGINFPFEKVSPTAWQVTHVLLTRTPLIKRPKSSSPFDLHVLSTPPAFVLSQDQTLQRRYICTPRDRGERVLTSSRNCPGSAQILRPNTVQLSRFCCVPTENQGKKNDVVADGQQPRRAVRLVPFLQGRGE